MRNEKVFFNGDYAGTLKECFPPAGSRICMEGPDGLEKYAPSKQLRMEEFDVSIMNSDGAFGVGKVAKDLLHLAVAELCLQRGFSRYTVTQNTTITSCVKGYSASTFGSSSSGYYSGTSHLSPRETCVASFGITVLMYDDQSEIARGVLYRGGSWQPEMGYRAYINLYRGDIPNTSKSDWEWGTHDYGANTPYHAWKSHYDAAPLAEALRQKYGTSVSPYVFIDDRTVKQAEQAEPLERYKVAH